MRGVCGESAADVLKSPNNILAVEYLRALGGSQIKPLAVKRVAAAHDSEETGGEYASASKIRAMLRRGEDVSAFVPAVPKEITYPQLLERAVLFRLRLAVSGLLFFLDLFTDKLAALLSLQLFDRSLALFLVSRLSKNRCRA